MSERVKWTEFIDMPEEFYERATAEDYKMLVNRHEGNVIGCVRSWGETKLVVMLDSGKTREVKASSVERAPARTSTPSKV